MGAGISRDNRSVREPNLAEIAVRVASQSELMPFDSLVCSCLDRLAGFTKQHATWAQTLFKQQQTREDVLEVHRYELNERRNRILSSNLHPEVEFDAIENSHKDYERTRLHSTKMVLLPESAHLVSFSRDINYRAVCDYLSEKKLELAPVQVLLSTLLTHLNTTPYESRSFDGSLVKSVDYHLHIPGPDNTQHRTVLAAGGYLKCDGIERDALFGARTGSRGLEFFLPYTTNVDYWGWRAGTLFLVQPKRHSFG
jgi:hypothetical protein